MDQMTSALGKRGHLLVCLRPIALFSMHLMLTLIQDVFMHSIFPVDFPQALLCQPAEVQGYVEIPSHIALWGLDR